MTAAPDCTILVVEDNDDAREMLAELFLEHGYRVETANNGRVALTRLEAMSRPCVVLLDLHMPQMDGWGFQSSLRSDPHLRDTPVIVVSAFGSHEALPRGVQGFVPKPVDIDLLLAMVARYCPAQTSSVIASAT